jgi:outer membrane protein insertion porin family
VTLRRLLLLFLFGGLVASSAALLTRSAAHAEVPKIRPDAVGETVGEVRVEGNRRVSEDEIRYNINLVTGQLLDLDIISRDIKRLYAMGFFDDIQVDAYEDAGQLVVKYILKEKPAIASLVYVGNDELDEDDFKDVVDIVVPGILNETRLKANQEKLQKLYADKGFYLAEVRYEVKPQPSGDVEVHFIIDEYAKVTVRSVQFIGTSAISSQELAASIFTREASILGFLSGAGDFKKEEFERDLQRITFLYADRGYPDARVTDWDVKISEDRESLFVTIYVEEGVFYTMESVDIRGDLIDDKAKLLSMLDMQPGAPFKLSSMFKDMETLRNRYRDEGYAYVNVEPKQSKSATTGTTSMIFDIQRGQRARFGRISMVGNIKTADKIIRRELLFKEGDQFNGTALQRSEVSVTRLGFFEKVTVSTQTSPTDPSQIDIQVEVKERPTGTFQIGAGFSSVENFIATLQISQDNFLGRGQSLTAQATFSSIRQLFNIQLFEPYFLDSLWRFRATIYNFQFIFNDFSRTSTGGTIGFGYPLSRYLTLDLTYTLETVDVSPGGRLGRANRNVGSIFRGGVTSSVTLTMAYDTRNNRLFPTEGFLLQGSTEVADTLLGSQNEFTRLAGIGRIYFPLFFNVILKFNLQIGYITNWNSDNNQPVPVFERFFVGGPNSVRGFVRSSLGPTRRIAARSSDPGTVLTGINIGGDKQIFLNTELEFPILTSVGIKGVFFFDAGNAFDDDQAISLAIDLWSDNANDYDDTLRTAAGFGIRWLSPIGPLRFEWGFPLAPLPNENDMVFEFSIGNSF